MRTMLILLFICSLAQFAIAQVAPGRENAAKIPIDHQCDKAYKCFVPGMCRYKHESIKDATETAKNSIDVVYEHHELYGDCAAIIKFHSYGKHWAHVSIESLDANINSIKFTIFLYSAGSVGSVFSCKRNTALDKPLGEYTSPHKSFTKTMDEAKATLKCAFDVKIAPNKEIFDGPNDNGQFEINGMPTSKSGIHHIYYAQRCDPSSFKLIDLNDDRKVYSEVKFKPDFYYCEHPEISKMEYRKEGTIDYKIIEHGKLTCLLDKFAINGVEIDKYANLDIRCVADAKYFCDSTQVKEIKGNFLSRQEGNKDAGKASELKCPDAHPYLFIRDKPIMGKPIECYNYGNKQIWTVDGQLLSSDGPEVYCSDKVDCKLLYKIPESFVFQGTLDSNYYPICHGSGVLMDANDRKVDTKKTKCDPSIGKIKYYVGSEEKIVDETTKFKCYYPPEDHKQLNKENEKKVAVGIIVAGVVSGLATFASICVVALLTRRSIRKQREQMEQLDNQLFVQFALTKNERLALLRKEKKERAAGADNKTPSKNLNVRKTPMTGLDKSWNDYDLHCQYRAMMKLAGPDGKHVETIKIEEIGKYTAPSVIDTLPKLLMNGPAKKNMNLKANDIMKERLVKVLDKKEYHLMKKMKESEIKKTNVKK